MQTFQLKEGNACIEAGNVDGSWYIFAVTCPDVKAVKFTLRLTMQYHLRFADGACLDWARPKPELMLCSDNENSQITLYDPKTKVGIGYRLTFHRRCTHTGYPLILKL